MITKTTTEILNNAWGEISSEDVPQRRTPFNWMKDTKFKIEDIDSWEEIYYRPGVIGVYVSWNPYEEFYIITHNLHLDKSFIEIFQGPDAVDDIIQRCKSFGVNIKYNLINQT